ncbi:MAG: hypothetical protein LH475_13280 [Cryobacterium sp.]|uniref:hypothetical protein n=1 Tax=unclassified Cryobacterium TaxID=2649013 RepID=UPI0018CB7651|nr:MULTISPECIES: hypothetical protein [unclassified Cryobacterium]MCY7405572.1 hypothetical protein [Cryobacterium sp.]MEC5154442.1 nitrate reductase assembly molybdenum cofactor insertion protein NarJ [Cryobacterium sp. CAN_C3]
MVLQFSALSNSPIAQELLAAHRDCIAVLRSALETVGMTYLGSLKPFSVHATGAREKWIRRV